ncbi:DUF3872 domain-containing protein [Proteiniphilum sp. UBA5346]|uniref:DUF3872 domain-containing protein n=1 Tax=Proteiniphilum sp. UBA5346 TaxID=1947277 RepID=UPI00257B9920|nr:DUF3872 domain-containing protein [Proteiniphilum sp. UBA5346]
MKKLSVYFLGLLLGTIACACNDRLDIQQVYSFDLVTMPVQKLVTEGETVEIRCQLVKEGEYQQIQYFIRYFQTDGKGELKLDDGTVLLPNDLYPLDRTTFRLYYTSQSTDQQVVDVYIEDNLGQVVQKTFSWQYHNKENINQN